MASGDRFDVIVVGAGPAGLSAARTAARLGFSTLVLEQRATPAELAHPCSAVIAPVPGLIAGQEEDGDLHFPGLGLVIPVRSSAVVRRSSDTSALGAMSFRCRSHRAATFRWRPWINAVC